MTGDLTLTRTGPIRTGPKKAEAVRANAVNACNRQTGNHPGTSTREESSMKKAYEKPRVVYAEKVEARAVGCAKADAASCEAGPIQS